MSMEVDEEEPSPTMSVTNEYAGISEHSGLQDHVSIYIKNMLRGIRPTSSKHSIFSVDREMREVNPKAYEPVILAIGPRHYGNNKFKFMEKQKLRYLQQLLNRRNEESVDRYVPAISELEQRVRSCYRKAINLSQESFLAMMLIDGCFIVELFRKHNKILPTDKDDPLMQSYWLQCCLRRDILLLENQLPLFVLSELYDLIKGPDEHHEFSEVAAMYFNFERGGSNRNWRIGEWKHLVHLYHAVRTSGLPEMSELNCILLMPSASELRESGVRFRAVEGDLLSNIKFKNGTLELPVLCVKDDTESKFRNLIAYEQQRQIRDINYFTDYVMFMDCLIKSSKDVEELRCAGIIKNYLGDDKVVAQMFNKIGDHIFVSDSYYSEIILNVNLHCNKRRIDWMAKLKREYFEAKRRREYFHSPWAFLSILAAIVLLFLTVAQTVFTILSYTK